MMAKSVSKTVPSPSQAWLYVIGAGGLEIVWAAGLKYAWPAPIVLVALLVSFDLLVDAAKVLPIGTAYAVFTSLGTAGTVIVEAVLSGGINWAKVLIIGVLLLFVVGLKANGEEVRA